MAPSPDHSLAGSSELTLVGVGASAGGLDALTRMFESVSDAAGLAFVIVQHLSPDHTSALAEILSKKTSLPVHQIEADETLRPGHIHVIPPGRYLSIEGDTLRLSAPPGERAARMAVDHFFRSLAETAGHRVVGVVLSGTGGDSTAGLQEIHAAGGLTAAQDPDDALHDGMPGRAVRAQAVDIVAPAEDLIDRIRTFFIDEAKATQARSEAAAGSGAEGEDPTPDIQPVMELLRQEGRDFSDYRLGTLTRRIVRRMGLNGLKSVAEYRALIEDHPDELQRLKRDLLIGVTRFFRNPKAWVHLAEKVIRPLVAGSEAHAALRLWCPGCATGEEAYSLAMLLLESPWPEGRTPQFQIFATDLSTEALDYARAGIYPDPVAADVGVERLRRFFHKVDGGYKVNKDLRAAVVFAEQNVLQNAPFSQLDLVCCRNMLIYFEREAQQHVLETFAFALKPGGTLFLGSSESVELVGSAFEGLQTRHRIYRAKDTDPPAGAATKPTSFRSRSGAVQPDPTTGPLNLPPSERLGRQVHRQLVRELKQGVAVVDRGHRVLFLEGRADQYLQLELGSTTGDPPDLFRVARNGLKARLRTLLHEVTQHGGPAEGPGQVERDGKNEPCLIKVRRLAGAEAPDGDPPLLITFEPPTADGPAASPARAADTADADVPEDPQQLRHELLTTRDQLTTTIAQLETANEELKASNEEARTMNEQLQSGNEELETSKEELQSLNEELTTLNRQLELKIQELQHTGDDLHNLLTSASIPTLFLDTDRRIRRFTPSCTDLYAFIPTDVGRPLGDIRALHNDDAIAEDIDAVLDDLVPRDHEVTAASGQQYLRRILPYRTEDDQIRGVVLTFLDVTELCEAKQEAARRLAVLRNIYRSAPVGLAFIDRELVYVDVNEELAEINGVTAEEHIGRTLADVLPPDLTEQVTPIFLGIMESGEPLLDVEIVGRTKADTHDRIWMASYMPVADADQQILGLNIVVQDVTDQRRRIRELADSQDQLGVALTAGRMGTWHWNLIDDDVYWSPQMHDLLGVNKAEFRVQPESFFSRVHPDDQQAARAAVDAALAGETDGPSDELRLECRMVRDDDRSPIWVENRGRVRRDAEGHPIALTGATIDIADRREHELAVDAARDQAESANRARGEFLANMSHEIRTPMTAILGYADLLAGRLSGDDEEARGHVATIRRHARFLLEILNDILDLSKIDAGRLEIRAEPLRPEKIVGDVASLMGVRAGEKGLQLDVHLDEPLPATVRSDAVRLRQILLNLVGNAIKFTTRGTVSLAATYDAERRQIGFSVSDTGIGIVSDQLKQLFQPFVQADTSITRRFGGTGLGLTISRRLAQAMGGSISVESKPNQGSTFTLSLPDGYAPDPAPPLAVPRADFAPAGREAPDNESDLEPFEGLVGRFLVVDDRPELRGLVERFIAMMGGTTAAAGNGRAAIDAVEAAQNEGEPFDAVCMDMQMPVMDGNQATRELRRRGIEVPIVALTANAMQSDTQACLDAGCTAFVSKPIDTEVLRKVLARVVGRTHPQVRASEAD